MNLGLLLLIVIFSILPHYPSIIQNIYVLICFWHDPLRRYTHLFYLLPKNTLFCLERNEKLFPLCQSLILGKVKCEWLCREPTICTAPWCYAVRCCHCWNIQVFNSWLWFMMPSKQAEGCRSLQHTGLGHGLDQAKSLPAERRVEAEPEHYMFLWNRWRADLEIAQSLETWVPQAISPWVLGKAGQAENTQC